jgi:hypothetical protein
VLPRIEPKVKTTVGLDPHSRFACYCGYEGLRAGYEEADCEVEEGLRWIHGWC